MFWSRISQAIVLMTALVLAACETSGLIGSAPVDDVDPDPHNMVVLGTTDCSRGRDHSIENYPILLAGSASNRLRMGVHHKGNGENASQVILSLIRAMGINAADFGIGPVRTTDGLSAIEV